MNLHNVLSTSIFSRTLAAYILTLTISMCPISLADASEKTQTLVSDWTVSPWNYYGDTAAMNWHYQEYQPWDPALGELREVHVKTEILGEHVTRAEDLRIRSSFFTGWSPADYQLSMGINIPADDDIFSFSESYVFRSPAELQQWVSYDHDLPAHFYFESRTVKAEHTVSAITTLTFIYDSLPDLLVLELVDQILNYEASTVLSGRVSSELLRDLRQVLTQLDQNNIKGACNGLVTFNEITEELVSNDGIEFGAAMLLIAEANQIQADLYCS